MKLRLVVVGGVHDGKAIPINLPQFVIGRDAQCQLRPASPAISKRHCAILVRGSQVFVRDFGSTNGTFVNGELVQGETELHNGDKLKVGPLEFGVGLEMTAAPKSSPKSIPAAAKTEAGGKSESVDMTVPTSEGPTSDKIAGLLLDDDGAAPGTGNTLDTAESVPEGSTIMELPAPGKPGSKPPSKTVVGTGNTSTAAAEILRKYQRRPRG
ncbi:MAG TPA: FHA domain-containing protein [Gemmataceae bacterium]|jgi:pSer/pThr/pTyr-binding forkhead associated (FHA) protein|nr:FHA domain-containing protein [Gemmataceae bacterium]